jgi:hypothetical protein
MALLDGAQVGSKWILRNGLVSVMLSTNNTDPGYSDRKYKLTSPTGSYLYRHANGHCQENGATDNDYDPVRPAVSRYPTNMGAKCQA